MVPNSRRMWMFSGAGAIAAALAISPRAAAVQHLVNESQNWEQLASKVRAGDEIILMPGRHRKASFESLMGTAQKPIIIRGADPRKPTDIVAERDREAIRIKNCSHVVIRDVNIVGGTICGVTITGAPVNPKAVDENGNPETMGSSITIRNVSISRVGPKGQRHGLIITGMSNVQIEDCRIEGWGGSGMELISCRDATILRCQFTGLIDHEQKNGGIRVRAGSDRIQIEGCRFINSGERAISIGGVSELSAFQPPLAANAPPGRATEAAHVRVEQCVIYGSESAIVFINADDSLARNNTIISPTRSVMALFNEHPNDPRFSPGLRNIFGLNISVWEPGTLKFLAETGPGADTTKFVMEQNVWWSGQDAAEVTRMMSQLPGESQAVQVMDVDPELDAKGKAWNRQVAGFGATTQ
ncbi:MAG: right-handed parallel beta-helix repeat-containing protein [Phycisphaerales bacterium]|nr:right-handed parallel beta-helix repeat-containing protein [Phycisphaerales bacterium]MCI0631739.1 right-handed parallel beta-helix repeat-containing protein [Phycisphaerales bacterium]MCI0676579.1 right-handed parallel beta-helix repeat-containing protein [Phycisphaerales bacterium]